MFNSPACGAANLGSRGDPFLASSKRAQVALSSSQTLCRSDGETPRSERLIALGQAACLLGAMRLAYDAAEAHSEAQSVPLQEHGEATEDEVSPERLLATGYAVCFLGALSAVAAEGQDQAPDNSVTATVTLGSRWSGEARFAVTLDVTLPGLDRGTAMALLKQAHGVCPYAHISRDAVGVTLQAA